MHKMRCVLNCVVIACVSIVRAGWEDHSLIQSLDEFTHTYNIVENIVHAKSTNKKSLQELKRACDHLCVTHDNFVDTLHDSIYLRDEVIVRSKEVILPHCALLAKKLVDAEPQNSEQALVGPPVLFNSALTMALVTIMKDQRQYRKSLNHIVALLIDLGAQPVLVERRDRSLHEKNTCCVMPVSQIATTETSLFAIAFEKSCNEYITTLLQRTPKEMIRSALGDTHVLRGSLPTELHSLWSHSRIGELVKKRGIAAMYEDAKEQTLLLHDYIALTEKELEGGLKLADDCDCVETLNTIVRALPFKKSVLFDVSEGMGLPKDKWFPWLTEYFHKQARGMLQETTSPRNTQKRCSWCDSCIAL